MSSPIDDLIEQARTTALEDADLQALMVEVVRCYAERVAALGPLPAFGDARVTATEVMITATALLRAANVELFELGMWQAWS